MLPGRTDNAVKNRFHITERARSREKAEQSSHASSSNNDDNASQWTLEDGAESAKGGRKRQSTSTSTNRKVANTNSNVNSNSVAESGSSESNNNSRSSSRHVSRSSSNVQLHPSTYPGSAAAIAASSSASASLSVSSPSLASGGAGLRWSFGTSPPLESSLIDDSDGMGICPQFKQEVEPNLLDFAEGDELEEEFMRGD